MNLYLKQIELENFKSFGGKLTIPLMEGYLAVTGPNGSGKSNISDAILFVLGPKSSKAIRAGKLTDLIFDGGKTKNKAEFTKVSLVFDNKDRMIPWDDDTVKLTRLVRLAQDGENYSSYFYVNDGKSSMTEFDNLLARARISAEGYNLVQQGDVTRIVQMGGLDRRRILDSISGIASFDADLESAGKEKAETEANIERIEIIIKELDTQLAQLEKDMVEARKYLEAQSKLDEAKAQMLHRQLENAMAEADGIREELLRSQNEIETLKQKKQKLIDKV
ncbi:MAG: AAA family ATPase, partial [Methanomassiliicoccaceae archaeon]|nr:AAA family ATPase [Methanomassiliicoccaceae archaeon]